MPRSGCDRREDFKDCLIVLLHSVGKKWCISCLGHVVQVFENLSTTFSGGIVGISFYRQITVVASFRRSVQPWLLHRSCHWQLFIAVPGLTSGVTEGNVESYASCVRRTKRLKYTKSGKHDSPSLKLFSVCCNFNNHVLRVSEYHIYCTRSAKTVMYTLKHPVHGIELNNLFRIETNCNLICAWFVKMLNGIQINILFTTET